MSPDDVIIPSSGATEALSFSLQAVAKRGDIIAVESPTYFSVLRLIEKMGMLALEIDTNLQTGKELVALGDAFDTMDFKAMLASPNISNAPRSLVIAENFPEGTCISNPQGAKCSG